MPEFHAQPHPGRPVRHPSHDEESGILRRRHRRAGARHRREHGGVQPRERHDVSADSFEGADIVGIYNRDKNQPDSYRSFTFDDLQDVRGARDVFTDVIGYSMTLVGASEGEHTRRTFAAIVSAGYFSTLNVHLAAGRGFSDEEERAGSDVPVVIVGYDFARKKADRARRRDRPARPRQRPRVHHRGRRARRIRRHDGARGAGVLAAHRRLRPRRGRHLPRRTDGPERSAPTAR